MKVLIAGDRRNERIAEVLDEAYQILSIVADVYPVDLSTVRSLKESDCELFFVFGGDGSILRTAWLLDGREVPVVGVNVGRLGFLTEFTLEEFREQAAEMVKEVPEPSPRAMFEVRLTGWRRRWYVLNEAAVVRRGRMRVIHIEFLHNGETVTTYAGDGVLVVTPTGTTAYSLAAGGPIATPNAPVMIVTPLSPHTLTNRPVVLPDDSIVTLKMVEERAAKVELALDGRVDISLEYRDEVTIQKSNRRFMLVENESFFKTLKKKLFWGGAPNYGEG